MPDISKIKLVLSREDEEEFDVKDITAREMLETLLGKESEQESSEE